MERRIKEFLQKREKEGLLRGLTRVSPLGSGRILVDGKEYINFSSNDYLGLAAHPDIAKRAQDALSPVFGVASSRLMTGSTSLHHELEERVASFKGKEAALIFNSGYQANVGIISSLCGGSTAVFSDRLNHASIVDGIQLSGGALFRFRHNDMDHLAELLEKERERFEDAFIVTETVFSMDGDIAPIEKIVKLKKRYNAILMADEAHATGIFGPRGSGIVEAKRLNNDVDIIMGTFSKALGSFGAYAALSKQMRDYLVNACRSFIYSTALPASVIAANLAALDLVRTEPFRRETLLETSRYFAGGLKKKGFNVNAFTQIIPIVIGETERTLKLSNFLKERGYWTTPVRPPTVRQGSSRLRISVTFDHTKEMVERFLHDLTELWTNIS